MKIIIKNDVEYEVIFAGADQGILWIRFKMDEIDFNTAFEIFNSKENIEIIKAGYADSENMVVYEGYTDLMLVQKEYTANKYNVLLALREET